MLRTITRQAACRTYRSTARTQTRSVATDGFKASDIIVKKTQNPKPKLANKDLVFGKTFTDHMLSVDWNCNTGWAKPVIEPYGNISISPAAVGLHYALQCFEGMKAYKDTKGNVRLFRPLENMKRLATSMERLAMPTLPPTEFLECIKALIRLDESFIPTERGYSLYIRPMALATTPSVMVKRADDVRAMCLLSPVGPYYATGFKPVALYADPVNVRAFPGGTGNYKIGGNYGPGILPAESAIAKGYGQILWLLNDEVTEVGTMNLFMLWTNPEGEKELITAPLDGTILPGVTRKSIIELAKSWGEFKVSEKTFTMTQVVEALKENRVFEIFGAGTAAIVTPVNKINYKGTDYDIPIDAEKGAGELTTRCLNTLMDIQYGELEHEDWSVVV